MLGRLLVWAMLVWYPAPPQTGVPGGTKDLPKSDSESSIETGFNQLYSLKFTDARRTFVTYQQAHADEPLGEASIAASHLFEEFYLQHVFTSDFFLDDRRLLGGIEGKPDAARTLNFNRANQRARDLAHKRMESNPQDADALLSLALAAGMQADYASILEKRQSQSLHFIREANDYAKRLLTLRPDMADAWLAIGAANYIVGCLPAHVRFFLWFGGTRGDRQLGMEQLGKTAAHGHYLRPFAKIFLALAAIREGQEDLARRQLSELVAQFPDNLLFADELARINRHAGRDRKKRPEPNHDPRRTRTTALRPL